MKKIITLIIVAIYFIACNQQANQQADNKKCDSSKTDTACQKSCSMKCCQALNKESQAAITPEQAVSLLKEGNTRFLEAKARCRNLLQQVKQTSTGQFPFAVILDCMDSRAPVEYIFDLGIGDAFVLRIAGNIVDPEILGSMEYATEHAGAKLILVMGHSHCGACKGAADQVKEGNLGKTIAELNDAVKASSQITGEHNSKNNEYVEAIVKKNIELSRKEIVEKSPVIKKLIEEGKVIVKGAFYDIETGKVDFLE